jgi:HK97 family phage major capsid protein
LLKSAVGVGTQAPSGSWPELYDADSGAVEFVGLANALTLVGRLPMRRVPPRTPGVFATGGASSSWVREGSAIPMSLMALDRATLDPLKVASLSAFSMEVAQSGSPESEALILGELLRAVALGTDQAFISSLNAGIAGAMPSAITYNLDAAFVIAGSGTLADDLQDMISAFRGGLASAAFCLHPKTAAAINLQSGGLGAGASVNVLGGTLVGLPAYTSEACEEDEIALLDADAILVTDLGATVERSTHATVEADSSPAGEGFSPTSASATLLSFFQSDLVGVKVTRAVNWKAARPGTVVLLTGASYSDLTG